MFDVIKKEKNALLFILLFFLANLCFFFLKQGSLTADVGREFYIPWQMLKGQLLYKDIFNIYGPLSYQINSMAYAIFGQKILTLYSLGVLNSFVILNSLYLISREFLSKIYSVLIVCFVAYACVFQVGLFNFNLPYSFAMIYGFSSFLLSVFCLIKYVKSQKSTFVVLSCLLCGFSIACKYEYLLFPLFIAYVVFFLVPLEKKELLKCIAAFLFFPLLSFGSLFIQGVGAQDFLKTINYLKIMSGTESIKHLYTYYSGTYFNLKVFLSVIKNFSYLAGLFFILFSFESFRKSAKTPSLQKFYTFVFILVTFLVVFFFKLYTGFGFFPMLMFLLTVLFIKIIIKEPSEFVLYASSIIASFKTFFALNLFVYGIFTLPLLLVAMVVFLLATFARTNKYESVNNAVQTSVLFLLAAFVLYFAFVDFNSLKQKSSTLITNKGYIHGAKGTVSTYDELIDFVLSETKPQDKVLMLPEAPFINFLTQRDSDNYYHSLIPLYFDTFGEDNVIEHFQKNKPEYIVINNRNTADYGHVYMCVDYAFDFCNFVEENYSSVKIIEGKYKAVIYKRKDLK